MLVGLGAARAEEAQGADQAADKPVIERQTLCPIMGGAINTNLFVDALGKRVYFCCGGCPKAFKKNPAKYIAKLEEDGVTLDKAPEKDPAKEQSTDAEAAPPKGRDHSAMKGCGG